MYNMFYNVFPYSYKLTSSITTGRGRCNDCEKNLESFRFRKVTSGRSSSSKIRRMLEILKTPVDGNKSVKTIIFSQFTSMLDLIEPFLHDHNIKFGRCNSPSQNFLMCRRRKNA